MPLQTVPRFDDASFTSDTTLDPTREVTWGTAPKLNFENTDGQILMFNDSGQMIMLSEGEAAEQLVVKSIITERFWYPCYGKDFGSDFWVLIGRGYTQITAQTLCETFVRECLQGLNTIRIVDQIQARVVGDILYLQFRAVFRSGHMQEFSFTRTIG